MESFRAAFRANPVGLTLAVVLTVVLIAAEVGFLPWFSLLEPSGWVVR